MNLTVKIDYPDISKTIKGLIKSIKASEIANIIKEDIKDNIDKGKNWNGSGMKPIQRKTIDLKRKKGGINPSKPLIFKGGSRDSIVIRNISDKESEIISRGNASGYYGGKISSEKMFEYQIEKGRDPFGISKRAEQEIEKYITKKLG